MDTGTSKSPGKGTGSGGGRKKGSTLKLRAQRGPRPLWLRLLLGALALGGLGLLGLGAIFYYYAADPDLPNFARAADYRPKLVTRVLGANGELIGEIFEERRTLVPREKIPPVMIHALLDAEDAQFYEHKGLDYSGMARALLHDLKPGAHLQGASTITQQLVRKLILRTSARTVKRKVQELILARRIERALTKDDILYLYLNQIDFPYQRFGIEEASRFYFGKSVSDVNAAEAALLASLPKAPTDIDPIKHPERAKERQRYVLSQMVRYGHLPKAEAERFAAEPIRVVRDANPNLGIAPEFVELAKQALVDRIGAKQVPYIGTTVTTSCDPRIQRIARGAVDKGLAELDARNGYRKPLGNVSGRALEERVRKLTKAFPEGPSMGRIVEGVVRELKSDGARVALGAMDGWLPLPAEPDRYNPKGLPPEKRFSVGDVLRVRVIEGAQADRPATLALELGPQAAVVVIDPQTRQVRALIGGQGYRMGAFNRATQARRQPGSAFKPFLWATALASERFTAASVLNDSPQVYATPGLKPWQPQNAEKHEHLGPVRLRVALAKSLNTIASQLIDEASGGVGADAVVALAQAAGIESKLQANPSLALGTSEVTPLELANAYATFAAGGLRRAPVFVLNLGANLDEQGAAPREDTTLEKVATVAMTPELAYVMTSMMSSVVEEGTAISARGRLDRTAAGKTGTTDAQRDAWFVGYTPQLVTGVWVGFDDMKELGRGEQGARAALPIWIDVMNGALKGVAPSWFTQPPGVVVQRIDPKTGAAADPSSPGALDEVFLEGTGPVSADAAAPGTIADPDTFLQQ